MRRRVLAWCCTLISTSVLLGACGGEPAPPPVASIPQTLSASGDVAKGEQVFQGRGCPACHNINTELLVGPGLAGVTTATGPKHPEGVDYGGNLPNGQARSEEQMAAWIRSGGTGKIGTMTPNELNDTDMADLLAYLRTLNP